MDTTDLLVNTTSLSGCGVMQIVNVNLTRIPLILANVRIFLAHDCNALL